MKIFKLIVGDVSNDIDFPQGYHELTYSQFLRLRLEYKGDVGHLLEILTDVPRSVWMDLPESEYDKIVTYLNWISTDPLKWEELTVPTKITIAGKEYDLPTDLGFESFGQKIVLEAKITQVISSAMNPPMAKPLTLLKEENALTPEAIRQIAVHKNATSLIALIPYVVATYMQPRVNGGKFDEAKITALELELLKCRAVEVYPIGSFFIRTSLGLRKPGVTPLKVLRPKAKVGRTKKKPVSKKSKKKRGTS